MKRLAIAALALCLGATQQSPVQRDSLGAPAQGIPFGIGERIVYSVKGTMLWTPLASGTGEMSIDRLDTVRGRQTMHINFVVTGGGLGFKVNDRYESWLDPRTMSSLRYREDKHETGYKKNRVFEIFPDRRQYTEDGGAPRTSVEEPLDDGSFLYFIRTVPLVVGQTYTYHRYFREDRNPVTVKVVRRERIRVAGQDWDGILINPIISTSDKGLLAKDSKPEIWLSADDSRIILKMKSKLITGAAIEMTLKSYCPPTASRPGRPCV